MNSGKASNDGKSGVRRRVSLTVLAAVVLAAVGIALVASLGTPSGAPVDTARVERRNLTVPILSDGTLEPPPGGELRAPEAATVAAILVADGDRVTRGQELVRLEDPNLAQAAREARGSAIELSDERVRAEAEAAQARREAEHLRSVADSDRRLVAQSAIPPATAEADEVAARQAADRLRSAEARVTSLSGNRGNGPNGPRGAARAAISDASARELERRVAALSVRAPADGVVYGLPRKTGETIAAGQPVASVADPSHLRVRARVDEPDLPRIAAGQKIVVTFDGLPDRRWEGNVLSVPSGVRDAGGRQVGEIAGEISDPKLSLPPNASVNVQIVVGEKPDALAIPRAALQREGDGRFVWALEGGRARRRRVSVGLVGTNDVEVAGLPEGTVVILPGGAPLREGQRVLARPRS